MSNITEVQRGWLQAFIAILVFLGLNNVITRYSSVILNVDPIIYTSVAFASCSFALIFLGRFNKINIRKIFDIHSCIYVTIVFISYLVALNLFKYTTATQGTILQKNSVLLGIIISWIFFNRKPDSYSIIGTAITMFGVLLTILNIHSPDKGIIILLTLLFGIFQILRFVYAEINKKMKNSLNLFNLGVIMFFISMLSLFISYFLSNIQLLQKEPISCLPNFDSFNHTTILFAWIIGLIIVFPLRVLEMNSSKIIKAENFAVVSTTSFIATIFWECLTSTFTNLDISSIKLSDIVAGLIITFGGLLIAVTRNKVKKSENISIYLNVETQNLEHIEDTRNIIANSLEHFHYNLNKVSKALELPINIIEKIMLDKTKTLTLNEKYLRNTGRNYRKNVAQCDSLTGLLNRTGFMTELKTSSITCDKLSLFYLDLNKFKPVNDTYGHDAGDFILAQIGKKLKNLFPNNAHITRLGGDEFCILLENTSKEEAQKILRNIKNKICEAITLENNETVCVGVSIGLANYPEDTNNPRDLLNIADELMLKNKKGR